MTTLRVPAWPVALLLALVVGGAVTAAPARGQEACDGVRVVVDAAALGGPVTSGCATGDPATGLDALRGAGHTYTFVPRQPGLVCTIDARPDPCNGAPQDAYWSYWHAPAGGSWTYSTRGAGNRDPEPGTVEGWAFGAGDPPREPPPAAAPAAAEPAPTSEPEPQPAQEPEPRPEATTPDEAEPRPTSGTTAPGDATATATDEGTTASLPVPSASASPPVLETPPGPDDTAEPSPSPDPLAGEVATDPESGGGVPVGLLAGLVLIAGLAGAAVLRARRRADG